MKHTNLEGLLKVIMYAAESPLGLAPMFYHIKYNNQDILFTESGALNTVLSVTLYKIKNLQANGLNLRDYLVNIVL
ncbi:MAG TPA: hypothetical protein VIP70_05270 [Nitrososphaeraceae archaeon]